ncbi:hypothetical protein N7495_003949 [Penicillium taxi]|uniref:uncharacterized protein n=1 Tax=Penicillium taxi TaxID=168475 RepID=UPI002544E5AD|nr:uncharacterized protein N7495_003949 [Penicillium taxi]KAJ5899205.1 hypothetical protein N7495_003949 [Penicillium taxi]
MFGPQWILREKILSQFQRQGSGKKRRDVKDVKSMMGLCKTGASELDFSGDDNLKQALSNLLGKKPELADELKALIKCPGAFGAN